MGKLTIDYSLPYCDGAYMLKALPQPEPQREPENEMDALYIKAMRDYAFMLRYGIGVRKDAYSLLTLYLYFW